MPTIAYLLLKESEPLKGGSAFSYECARCLSCCKNSRIPVNPYDVLRMSRTLSLNTTAFLSAYVDDGSSELKRDEGGCVFLENGACGVYAGRPLVCRLYPLRKHSGANESFSLLSGARGNYGTAGTVAKYLGSHEAEDHLRWLERYIEAARHNQTEASGPLKLGIPAEWMDVDAVIAKYRPDAALSEDEAKLELHLELLKQQAAKLSS